MDKKICGHCVSYDMWCGICLHPLSESFKNDYEYIYDNEACELYKFDEENYGNESKNNTGN